MHKIKITLKWVVSISALFVALYISLAIHNSIVKSHPFFSTSSPRGTYMVNLTGQKERPILFTAEVHFSVLKNDKMFLNDAFLHSGDSGDLSFETGYPNHAWVSDNVIRFYNAEYSNGAYLDTLIIVNNTDQVIKYLKVETVDKFLIFDIEPGATISMFDSPPRGDYKQFGVIGGFSDGNNIKGNGTSLIYPKDKSGPFAYYIFISANNSIFKGPQME